MLSPRQSVIAAVGVAALALAALVGPVNAPAAQAAKPKALVTISAPKSASPGASVKITGTVKVSTTRKAVKRVKVTIQQKVGAGAWGTAVKVKTNAKGKYTAKVTLAANTKYRARVAKTSTRRAGVSATKTVKAIRPPTPTPTPPVQIQAQTLDLEPLDPDAIDSGGTATAQGTASGGLVGYQVSIQANDGGTWREVAVGAVAPNRSFSIPVTLTGGGRSVDLRASSAGNPAAGIGEAVSQTRALIVLEPQTVTLNAITPDVIDVGATVTATGTTSPGLVGKEIRFQIQDGQDWGTLAAAVVAPDATFTVSAPVNSAGKAIQLRAASPGDRPNGIGEAASAPRALTVYAWYPLTDFVQTSKSDINIREVDSAAISGTTYPYSISFRLFGNGVGETHSVRYNLSRSCTAFRATVGVSENARDAATTYTAAIRSDDAEVWRTSTPVGLHNPVPVNLSLARTLDLKIESRRETGTGSGGDSPLIIGSPQVRCAR
jgi:hypothetical protein